MFNLSVLNFKQTVVYTIEENIHGGWDAIKLSFPEIKKTNGGPRVINHTITKVIKNFSEKCQAKNCAQEWAEKKKRAFIKYNEPFYAINGAHGITKFVNGISTSDGFGNLEKSIKLGKELAAKENVRFIEPEEKSIPIVDIL